ncbi:MAG: L-threonate dehydrogenase [Pseudomonadota bacterium]
MAEKRTGFIGLGAMGAGMATNLVKAGFPVTGYDIRPEAVETLKGLGGNGAVSPAEAAEGADILFVMVATADQAEAVLFGDSGAVTQLPAGAIVILTATVPPDYAKNLAGRLKDGGHRMLDAPVSGGTVGAEGGNLTIMASGAPDVFDDADAALRAIAGKVYRLGDEPGIGSTVKMVNQLLAGVHIAAAAEAMALGTRAGADPRTLYEVISNSAGNSWMFTNRVPHMLDGDYTPLSAVEIFVKDLGIVLDTGRGLRFPLPIAGASHQMFLAAAAAGHGREDDSAVVKVYEQLADISVTTPHKED